MAETVERDDVLGTDDDEMARPGVRHRVWRPFVLACWQRAGITSGSRVLDVGAGPGYATLDLAEIAGSRGEVFALERSARFLKRLTGECQRRALSNVRVREVDLMADELGVRDLDAAWCRWVTCFVSSPAVLVAKIAAALKPGGEPDIALALPALLHEAGLRVRHAMPLVFAIRPRDDMWQWPSTFLNMHVDRLVEMGHRDPQWADEVRGDFAGAEQQPATMTITPMVLEIVAEKN